MLHICVVLCISWTYSLKRNYCRLDEIFRHWQHRELFDLQLCTCSSHTAMVLCLVSLLTHWGRDKIDAILQTTFSNAISWMKMFEFRLRFHWSLFLRVELTIIQHWFRSWLGADQATSHYLNQWWLVCRRIYASLGLNELTDNSPLHNVTSFVGITPLISMSPHYQNNTCNSVISSRQSNAMCVMKLNHHWFR